MLLALLLLIQAGASDSSRVYSGRDGRLDVRIPRIEADVTIDGQLDEPAWQNAALLTGFSQYAPNDGVPASDSTEVLVWYSATAIHFGIILEGVSRPLNHHRVARIEAFAELFFLVCAVSKP